VTELVALAQVDSPAVPEELRTLALRCIASQLSDRTRGNVVVPAITRGGQGGMMAVLLHKGINSVIQQAKASGHHLVVPGSDDAAAAAAAAPPPAAAGASSSAAAAAEAVAAGDSPEATLQPTAYSVSYVDALMSIVGALVSSTSGCSALADAGITSAFLPLLRDTHPDHMALVSTAVRILEIYLDFSQPACILFRDLGGLHELIARLAFEVGVLGEQGSSVAAAAPGAAEPAAAVTSGSGASSSMAAAASSSAGPAAPPEAAAGGSSSAGAAQAASSEKPPQVSHRRGTCTSLCGIGLALQRAPPLTMPATATKNT
jgi:E3 ubiquitin-protein ligase HUWE1